MLHLALTWFYQKKLIQFNLISFITQFDYLLLSFILLYLIWIHSQRVNSFFFVVEVCCVYVVVVCGVLIPRGCNYWVAIFPSSKLLTSTTLTPHSNPTPVWPKNPNLHTQKAILWEILRTLKYLSLPLQGFPPLQAAIRGVSHGEIGIHEIRISHRVC